MTSTAIRGFRRLCLSTLIAVYFLIMVGGIVRSTGSGMGCPDWPRCFGSWTPPTSIEQLPADYKKNYAVYRDRKNQKFARYLRMVGMNETADKIVADKSILAETEFNATKTWIEYINRLVGVVIGFFIIALFYKSFPLRSSKPILFWISLATLITVIFQGWFGSIVVSTNLTTWTITVHFFIALLMVAFLAYLLHESSESQSSKVVGALRGLLLACISALLIQVFLGTEVREAIDILANSVSREAWIDGLGKEFIVHRSFSWAVLILNGFFCWQTRKTIGLKALSLALFVLILASFVTGVGLSWLNVPAAIQPVHLVLATIAFGIQMSLFFRMNKPKLENE
ncbi:MAG TPA: COX15/CtaA family protein [Cyclobacteriaceae bacterium]|nr:COX15/CtaA family protein [Cyclobacteriaceae bacterium]